MFARMHPGTRHRRGDRTRVALVALLVAGCAGAGEGTRTPDASRPVDAARERYDAAVARRDAGGPIDAQSDVGADASATPTACTGEVGERDREWTLSVERRERRSLVHLPPSYDGTTRLPVVVSLHALGSSAVIQRSYTGLEEVADAEGFVILHPSGIGGSWNGGSCCGIAQTSEVDDVAFLSALFDRIESELCVDAARIYVTGMSNGGIMAHRVGCELADRVAAIAPVAGVDSTRECQPARPLPVLQIHGTLDTVVPFSGAERSVRSWRERNRCRGEATVFVDDRGVTCERFDGCDGGAVVEFCTIRGGGHVWPSGLASVSPLDANATVWSFLSRHRRP